MSWSNSWIGRRAGILAAMHRYRATLTGQSQAEFDQAHPHLAALVTMNTNGRGDPVLQLDASGHANRAPDTVNSYVQVSVTLKSLGSLAEE